jgi:tRNA modification GTPase
MIDTLVAQATAPGYGGIGVIRLSGPNSLKIAQQMLGFLPQVRYAHYSPFLNASGHVIDQGITLFFKGPHSFTGEDVIEFQAHGGPVVLKMLYDTCLALGARPAKPGEFSQRAFLNEKMDLTQAEAVMDLIHASSEQAARSALNSLQGAFSTEIDALIEQLTYLRMYVESSIDFPEEDIDFLSEGHIQGLLDALKGRFQRVMQSAQQGQLLREGMTLVIVGKPNAGKSSLLNALSGKDSAIVTEIAGTTRDVLKEEIHIDGMPLHLLDTAGLRETNDQVEQEGMRRAWNAIEKADAILMLLDGRKGLEEEHHDWLKKIPAHRPIIFCHNKIDLTHQKAQIEEENGQTHIFLSAKHHLGLDLLKTHLKEKMGYHAANEGSFIARARHVQALRQAGALIDKAQDQLIQYKAAELVAEELRLAQESLSSISGRFTSDDLLGEIFANFCIGK